MRILTFDQALGKTGWAYLDNGVIAETGVINSKKLTDLEAVMFQSARIIALAYNRKPDLVLLEGVHSRRNVGTLIKLAGLLMHLRAMLERANFPHEVIPSTEIMKFLHLTPGTSRTNKIARARRVAADFLHYPDLSMSQFTDDECSAMIICAVYLARSMDVYQAALAISARSGV